MPTIVTAPSDILKTPTQKVGQFDQELKKLVTNMTKTMRQAKGIGFAANQIGKSLQVMIVKVDLENVKIPLTVIVNPKVLSTSAKLITQTEGCLSVPTVEVEVPRHESIKIKGFNLKGKPITIAAKGLFARIIQHELDHLNGMLITDRGNIIKHEHQS